MIPAYDNELEVVIFAHRLWFDNEPKRGGIDFIIDYLIKKKRKILLVESPLDYSLNNKSLVTYLNGKTKKRLKTQNTFFLNNPLSWVNELYFFVTSLMEQRVRDAVCIAADPLTALGCLILKKLGISRFVYFHLTDYSIKRFENKLLNLIYRLVLTITVKNSDLVGHVSNTVTTELTRLGARKLIYIPNAREFAADRKYRKSPKNRIKFSMVTSCAIISESYLMLETLRLVKSLTKQFPNVHLNIIGGYDTKDSYIIKLQKYINKENLSGNITFAGYLTKEKNLEMISNSWIGIAFFGIQDSYRNFADSLKIREYASLGIPTVSDRSVISTVKEMEKYEAGYGVSNMKSAEDVISKFFIDIEKYIKTSENTLRWARDIDKGRILKELYGKLFNEENRTGRF